MIRVKFTSTVPGMTRRQQRALERLPREAYNEFVRQTPIDTGNARKNTRLRGDTIDARYDYAQRLDEGWSRQAPDGMVEPTVEFVEKRFEQIIKRG
jgi:hypothetical protein